MFSIPQGFGIVVVSNEHDFLARDKFLLSDGLLKIPNVELGVYSIVALDSQGDRQIQKKFVVTNRETLAESPPPVVAFVSNQAADGSAEDEATDSEQDDGPTFAEALNELRGDTDKAAKVIAAIRKAEEGANGSPAKFHELLGEPLAKLDADLYAAALMKVPPDQPVADFVALFKELDSLEQTSGTSAAPSIAGLPDNPTEEQQYDEQFETAIAGALFDLVRDFDPKFSDAALSLAESLRQALKSAKPTSETEIRQFRKALRGKLTSIVAPLGSSLEGIAPRKWDEWYVETQILLYLLEVPLKDRNDGSRADYYQELVKNEHYAPIVKNERVFAIGNWAQQKQALELIATGLVLASETNAEQELEQRGRTPGNRSSSTNAAAAARGTRAPGWYRSLLKCKHCRNSSTSG